MPSANCRQVWNPVETTLNFAVTSFEWDGAHPGGA